MYLGLSDLSLRQGTPGIGSSGLSPSWQVTPTYQPSGMVYSGASLRTQVNADGSLGYGPHNLLLQSADFTQAAWIKSACTFSAPSLTASSAGANMVQVFASQEGQTYTSNFEVSVGNISVFDLILLNQGVAIYRARFDLVAGTTYGQTAGCTSAISNLGGGRFACSITRTFTQGNNNDLAWIVPGLDGAEVAGQYINVHKAWLYVGALQPYYPTTSAAYFGLRTQDYSADPTKPGMLIEPQATNLLTYSRLFSDSSWTKTAVAVTDNAGADLFGGSAATLVVPSATLGNHILGKNVTAAGTAQWTFAVKAAGLTKIGFFENQNTGAYVTFQLSGAGTVLASGSGGTGTITPRANGWYIIQMGHSNPGLNGVNLYFLPNSYTTGAPTAAWTGDGVNGVLVDLGQVEIGSTPTSTIPTAASQVTRAADVLYWPTSSIPGFNATKGTLYAQYVPNRPSTSTDKEGVFVSYTDGNNYLASGRTLAGGPASSIYTGVFVAGATQAYFAPGPQVQNARNKIALAYTAAQVVSAVNGASASAAITALPASPVQLRVGHTSSASEQLNGTIYDLRYYPQALPAATLQALTA